MSLFDRIKDLLNIGVPAPKKVSKPSKPITPPKRQKTSYDFERFFPKVRASISKLFKRQNKIPMPSQTFKEDKPKKEPVDLEKQVEKEIKKNAEDIRKKFYEQSDYKAGDTINTPLKSEIILQELERRIATWEADLEPSSGAANRNQLLKALIEREISMYGRAKVAYSCEQAGQILITNAEVWVFDSKQETREQAWTMILILIKGGEVPSEEERKSIGEAMEMSDEYNPFEE